MRLNITESAKYLNISKDTLRRWEKRGYLTSFRTPSNRRYYTKEILDKIKRPNNYPKQRAKKKNNIRINALYIIFITFILVDIVLITLYLLFK